jgi:hypothetical protein
MMAMPSVSSRRVMMRGYSPAQISQIRAILVSIATGRISVPNGGWRVLGVIALEMYQPVDC